MVHHAEPCVTLSAISQRGTCLGRSLREHPGQAPRPSLAAVNHPIRHSNRQLQRGQISHTPPAAMRQVRRLALLQNLAVLARSVSSVAKG